MKPAVDEARGRTTDLAVELGEDASRVGTGQNRQTLGWTEKGTESTRQHRVRSMDTPDACSILITTQNPCWDLRILTHGRTWRRTQFLLGSLKRWEFRGHWRRTSRPVTRYFSRSPTCRWFRDMSSRPTHLQFKSLLSSGSSPSLISSHSG